MAAEADDGGGSFWATFSGPATGAPELSPLETLLQSPDCSVEALFDDEECLQEFKHGNDKLLSRLRTVDACLQIVDFITCEPPENATHSRCYRYPFVSVELMTCNPEFFGFFVAPENSRILDALWGFLEATSPDEMNPVLAGYFSRAVICLLSMHTQEVVEYLKKRGAERLLQCFLQRLHYRSLAELFARLICMETPEQMIFPVEGIVARLLLCLEDPAAMSDTQENVTLVILEMLSQRDNVFFGDQLMAQLTSPQVIRLLVDHVFSGKADNVSASASILSSVIWNSVIVNKGPDFHPSPSTLSPMSPPLLTLGMADDDVVNTGEDSLDSLENEAALPRNLSSSSPPRSPAIFPSTPKTAATSTLMAEVCLHFKRIRGLLDAVLERSPILVPTPIGQVQGIGSTMLEVMNLLAMLARTGCEEIFQAIQEQQLLPRCLEMFFRHPWSSLLHNSIRLMLKEVLSSTEGVRPALVLRLLKEGGLVERVVNEFQEEKQYSSGERKRHPRVGYMGHLHTMAKELRSFGDAVPECGAALDVVSGWSDIVVPELNRIDKVYSEQLGGGIPDGSAGLASSNVQANGGRSAAEEEFVLDDLAELDGDGAYSPTRHVDPFDPDQFVSTSPGSEDSSNSWAGSFNGADAFTADFNQPSAFNADFSQTSGFGADFSQGSAFGADFSQASAFDADFSQTKSGDAGFGQADSFGADFSQAKSFDADFNKAENFDADFSKGETKGYESDLCKATSAIDAQAQAQKTAPIAEQPAEGSGSFWAAVADPEPLPAVKNEPPAAAAIQTQAGIAKPATASPAPSFESKGETSAGSFWGESSPPVAPPVVQSTPVVAAPKMEARVATSAQAAPGGSFWDVATPSESPPAVKSTSSTSPSPAAARSQGKEALAFESAFAPIPPSASASSPDSIKQEDLLNVLGGNLWADKTEKRAESPWSTNTTNQWPSPSRPPVAAVPSTCAPTSSGLEDLSWNAFGGSAPSTAGSKSNARAAAPMMGSGSSMGSASPIGVGTENLFALLTGPAPSPALQPVFPASQAAASTPWPAAASSSTGTTMGWQADFGDASFSASPGASTINDPFGPIASPMASGGASAPTNWAADFDPFASTAPVPAASTWPQDKNLANLDLFR